MKSLEKKFKLKNLFCAHCAGKIEKKILELPLIKGGYYNFSNQILTLSLSKEVKDNDLKSIIQKIIDKIENGVEVEILSKNTNHEHSHDEIMSKRQLIFLSLGFLIFVINISFVDKESLKSILFVISYLFVGLDVVWKAFKDIGKKNFFDENFLMTIATFGAFGIGEYPEASAVMIFYKIGEYFQGKAVSNSRKSIKDLMNIKPEFANLLVNGEIKQLTPEEIKVGDIIVVKAGERIPLDGKVLKGASTLDTSMLTGESKPRKVEKGSEVLSGSINKNGALEVEVKKSYYHSTVNKILELIENAGGRKCKTEKFISKFSKYYTPFVVLSAILITVIPTFIYGDFNLWLYRSLIFLVISCPCALVISVPLGFFGGIGRGSKDGILIKGSSYLDSLNQVDSVIFDKTGTLTKGNFEVTEIFNEEGISKDEILELAAKGELYSNHPIALSIKEAYGKKLNNNEVSDYQEIEGLGVKVKISGIEVLIGNRKMMAKENISFKEIKNSYGTSVYIAKERKFMGSFLIRDEIKENAKEAIRKLKKLGKKVYMLTGDNKETAEKISELLDIDRVYYELLPQNKVDIYEEIKEKGRGLAIFVGDGINDAPVLSRADVGISMGGVGSDAAIEASDIVLMEDDPIKISRAFEISKKTKNIVIQNIVFALGVKVFIMIFGLLGNATMWEAIFADVGVALIAILNSMRALKK